MATGDATAGLSEEARAQGARVSKRLMGAFGEIATVVMRSKKWRERPIRDLEALVLPPLLAGQFSLAEVRSKANGPITEYKLAPVAVVLWARVSAEVDARLSAAPEAPLRLMPAEWTSGDIIWVVEAIGEAKVLREMLKRLAAKEWTGKAVKMRARDREGRAAVAVLGSVS